jgi:glutathione synthase/RimK-type ligase-like ATP-grasp enzyme
MSNIMITMAEDTAATTAENFGIRYPVDEYDCLDFAQSLKDIGHQIYFVNWKDLEANEFQRMFDYNNSEFVRPVLINKFDLIFVYKMEGFYSDIPRFTSMLDRFEVTSVINDTATIRHNLSKNYLWQLAERDVDVIPCFYLREINERIEKGERFVVKPLRGERGKGIFLANSKKDLRTIAGEEDFYFAQEFMECIQDGERSLVFLGHEYQHAVIKHPSATNKAEFRCNESLGGTVAIYEPTEKELSFCKKVLQTYEELGYPAHFSRIDILNSSDRPVLLEAELLNPSIYANYSKEGKEFGLRLANYFEQFIAKNRRSRA